MRREGGRDRVSRAHWLQAFFENGQVLFPTPHLERNRDEWQALHDERIPFPSAEHDDLFDALETTVDGAMVPRATVEISY